jgi:tight adherence protein C
MHKFVKGLLITFCIVAFSIGNSFAQDRYNEMSERELVEFYRESCNKDYTANCFQLALMYKDPEKDKNSYLSIQRECKRNADKERERLADKEKEFNENDIPICELQNKIAIDGGSLKTYYLKKACPDPRNYIGNKSACDELNQKGEFEGSLLIYYSALILAGLAVFIITKTVFQDEDQYQAQEKLEDNKQDDLKQHGFILQISRPFFRRYFTPIVASMKNKKGIKEKYRRPLAAAGLTSVLSPDDFYSFKLFLIIGFPIGFAVTRMFIGAEWPMSLIPVVAIVGYYYPDFWIKGTIEQRQKNIIMNMPFSVDMLALSVEAGLDFIAAMGKVIEKSKKNPLTDEFDIVIKEIKIGASRAEALRNLAWRVDLIQISSFCATLIAADSVGANISPILKSLALEIRQKKSSEVEKAGATAATKILFPMMAFIVPSVLIVVFSPIIIEAIYGR